MPDTMSEERRSLLSAYGAKLVLTPDTRGMHGAIAKAEELVSTNPSYYHAATVRNHGQSRDAPPVHRARAGRSARTYRRFRGGSRHRRHHHRHRRLFAGKSRRQSCASWRWNPKTRRFCRVASPGFHKIQGIGAGFVPEILDTHVYDEIIPVSDEDATHIRPPSGARRGIVGGHLLRRQCCAALQMRASLGPGKVVAAIFCDTGERYLTTDLFQAEGI